eukprot:jgi/Tetstr1/457781/TSEL_044326.t1
MQKKCANTNHAQSTYLKSAEGIHLLYPETWSAADFVYHKNYGTAGQIRIPVLMNQNIDGLIQQTFNSLSSDTDFYGTHDTTSCAIVDSNADIEGMGFGNDIDRHSAVFRFGKPLAAEDIVSLNDTGTKTTFRAVTNQNLLTLLEQNADGERLNTTLLLFNKKAKTMAAIKEWAHAYKTLLLAAQRSRRLDIKVLMMSPLAYTGAKMALLDVAKCMEAGGGRVQCTAPSPTSKMTIIFAATQLCGRVTLYGNFAMAATRTPRSCTDIQKTLVRTLAANKMITVCGAFGCSNTSKGRVTAGTFLGYTSTVPHRVYWVARSVPSEASVETLASPPEPKWSKLLRR